MKSVNIEEGIKERNKNRFSRRFCIFELLACFCIYFWIFRWDFPFESLSIYSDNVKWLKLQNGDKTKILLYWTVGELVEFRDQKYQKRVQCGKYRCDFTGDRSLLNTSHAILFIQRFERADDLPETRYPWQRWVVIAGESPANEPRISTALNGRINWTMTYHRSSDIPSPYGFYEKKGSGDFGPFNVEGLMDPLLQTSASNYRDIVGMKSRSTLWMVSNCDVKDRNRYVKLLRRFNVKVDIFGRCGKRDPCKTSRLSPNCSTELFHKYKFYLAFENTHCEDYITEKLWKALQLHMLPIVMGPTMINYKELLPPDSFLHVDNFTGPPELAEYLDYLDKHDEAYSAYHAWRQHYSVYTPSFKMKACHLCRKLNEDSTTQVYTDMDRLWSRNMCTFPRSTNILK